MSRTVLLVEDNVHIMKINSDTLADAGYRVLEAMTLREARLALEKETPNSIVLDIMLPDGDGREFCKELRTQYGIEAPVLFLTALRKIPDMEKGYDAGGTDYLTKPFDLNLLVRKVTAQVEQYERVRRGVEEFCLGGLRLDFISHRAYLDGEDMLLKTKEIALLAILAKNCGRYVSAEELYENVWGLNAVGDVRTIWTHMSRLRGKFSETARIGIDMERGKGYCLVIDARANLDKI